MRSLTPLIIALALISSSRAAPDHQAPAKLTGTYSIGTSSLTDPAPGDAKDSLLRLYLTGSAATDLFNAISSKQKRDECFDDGTMTKVSGEIMCAKHPKGAHECWVGIDLKKQTLAPGFVC